MTEKKSFITFKSRPQVFLVIDCVDPCTGKSLNETMLVKYGGHPIAKQANGIYRIEIAPKRAVYSKKLNFVEEPDVALRALA